jgi:hypothetical protein
MGAVDIALHVCKGLRYILASLITNENYNEVGSKLMLSRKISEMQKASQN